MVTARGQHHATGRGEKLESDAEGTGQPSPSLILMEGAGPPRGDQGSSSSHHPQAIFHPGREGGGFCSDPRGNCLAAVLMHYAWRPVPAPCHLAGI